MEYLGGLGTETIQNGTKTTDDLPDPYIFKNFPKSVATRSSPELDKLQMCECDMCKVGRQNGAHGKKTKPSHIKNIGRPKHEGPDQLPLRKPVWICDRCKQQIGKGHRHPPNCGISEFRENVEQLVQSDPRGYEILASKLIHEKQKSAPKTSSTISLETAAPGHQMTLNKKYICTFW